MWLCVANCSKIDQMLQLVALGLQCFALWPSCNLLTWDRIATTLANICTVYSIHCTEYSVQCMVYIVLCTLYTVHCTLYGVSWTVWSVADCCSGLSSFIDLLIATQSLPFLSRKSKLILASVSDNWYSFLQENIYVFSWKIFTPGSQWRICLFRIIRFPVSWYVHRVLNTK